MINFDNLFTTRRLLLLVFIITTLAALAWSSYFFYTRIYQTITVQGAIVSLEPQVGRDALHTRQLKQVLDNLEKKQKESVPLPKDSGGISNPFSSNITLGRTPAITTGATPQSQVPRSLAPVKLAP